MGCPLLGVDPDAFNHDTEEFSAIAEVDPQPWCMGFYTVMKLRLLVWSRLLSAN
ncbi:MULTISPECIES: hypothetical protein [Bradyrhizobium]|uniref:hypothetical protein n=1 Tax=Bradyrhizobium pachyrhizi TaxID=280333 RepID=UPI000422B958